MHVKVLPDARLKSRLFGSFRLRISFCTLHNRCLWWQVLSILELLLLLVADRFIMLSLAYLLRARGIVMCSRMISKKGAEHLA